MADRNPDDVLGIVDSEGVEIVDLRFCDLPGLMQHFSVPAHQLTADDPILNCTQCNWVSNATAGWCYLILIDFTKTGRNRSHLRRPDRFGNLLANC